MNYLKIIQYTTVDGPGFRLSVYVSGCENHCDGCFNPETWDYNAGKKLDEETLNYIIKQVKEDDFIDGISLLGGDPFAPKNRKDLLEILKKIHDAGIDDVWVWTGHVLEELREDPCAKECLKYIYALVDGPFIKELKDPDLKYVGSSNQRVIFLDHQELDLASITVT